MKAECKARRNKCAFALKNVEDFVGTVFVIYPGKPFALFLSAALAAVLVACGGGRGPDPIAMTTINTTVMDGLIERALVCVDSNHNRQCDTDEIQGWTDVLGNVTLSIPSADMASASLLAIVGTNATDADTGRVTNH